MTTRILKSIKRKWLLFHIRGWQRDIASIRHDRDNGYKAEFVLRYEIRIAESKLKLEMM